MFAWFRYKRLPRCEIEVYSLHLSPDTSYQLMSGPQNSILEELLLLGFQNSLIRRQKWKLSFLSLFSFLKSKVPNLWEDIGG